MMRVHVWFICSHRRTLGLSFFFFNDTATTEIYTLSLHDALPISTPSPPRFRAVSAAVTTIRRATCLDRKSTRLNSSHSQISYAVFCLKKKKTKPPSLTPPLSGVSLGFIFSRVSGHPGTCILLVEH